MANMKMNSQKVFKIAIICYAAIFVIGIVVALIAGVKMDINFSGGSIISNAYRGTEKIGNKDVEAVAKQITKKGFKVTENKTYDAGSKGDVTAYTITFVGHDSLSAEELKNVQYGINRAFATKDHKYKPYSYVYTYTGDLDIAKLQTALNGLDFGDKIEGANKFTVEKLQTADGKEAIDITYTGNRWLESDIEKLQGNKQDDGSYVGGVLNGADYTANAITPYTAMELYSANSVDANLAGSFFLKSMVAVLLTAALVIVYVGLRFRKIGGVSAALTALCAVVFDVLVSFFVCVIFRLELDSNYLAVVLTILGYSLNDTIVVYDRVRENKKLYPQMPLGENMDTSLSSIMTRNIVTTVTTVLAVLTIILVSEFYGLTTLRTFAIPMTAGLISGCVSSLFIAGPLWIKWRKFRDARPAKAKK